MADKELPKKPQPPRFNLEKVKSMEIREDDVLVCTMPRSGTHWVSEIAHFTLVGHVDTEETVVHTFPLIEVAIADESDDPKVQFLKKEQWGLEFKMENMTSPRILMTHVTDEYLPTQMHDRNTKIIYCARNPKDAMISFYNAMKGGPGRAMKTQSVDEFIDAFIDGTTALAGYSGRWHEHVLYWWNKRNEDSVLFLKYEDMLRDLNGAVAKIAAFLGKDLTPEVINQIADHCTFRNMKSKCQDDRQHRFVQKGKVGTWKSHFTVALNERFDEEYKKWMEGTDLEIEFE